MGNTLHYIDKNVDLGQIISHKVTKLYKNDFLLLQKDITKNIIFC